MIKSIINDNTTAKKIKISLHLYQSTAIKCQVSTGGSTRTSNRQVAVLLTARLGIDGGRSEII